MKVLKSIILVVITIMSFLSCEKNEKYESKRETPTSSVHVKVVYFHGKQRCLTCRAIERFAKEAVDSCFGGNKSVNFETVDITTSEGEQIADKYEVAGSALLIIKTSGGKSSYSYKDMTTFAFQNARKNTPVFKSEVENTVKDYLN